MPIRNLRRRLLSLHVADPSPLAYTNPWSSSIPGTAENCTLGRSYLTSRLAIVQAKHNSGQLLGRIPIISYSARTPSCLVIWLVCFRIETVGTHGEATELCDLPARLPGGPNGWCGLPDATAGLSPVIPVLGSPRPFDSERTRECLINSCRRPLRLGPRAGHGEGEDCHFKPDEVLACFRLE